MSFSPSSFLANFSAESQALRPQASVVIRTDAARLTQPSLVDLLGRESEHG